MFRVEWRGLEREGDDAMMCGRRRGRVVFVQERCCKSSGGEWKERRRDRVLSVSVVCHSKEFCGERTPIQCCGGVVCIVPLRRGSLAEHGLGFA